MENVREVVIIGGGPAGLSAAVYLARANVRPLVIAGDPPGGQLMYTSEVENFPSHRAIQGQELVMKMREQAIDFGAEVIDANVTGLVTNTGNGTHEVHTSHTQMPTIRAKAVLIATGAKALWIGIEAETRLRGKGVSACATCDGFFFRNKNVVVVGGGDSALEEALFLTKFAAHVTVIHRRDAFRASRIMQDRVLHHEKISVIWNAQVKDIEGDDRVSAVLLLVDGVEKRIEAQGVFVAIGHKPDTVLFTPHILLDKKGYVLTQSQMAERMYKGEDLSYLTEADQKTMHARPFMASETSKAGIFAAGDCADTAYRQASTAAGMGVAASLDIERYLQNFTE